jgi:dTMP kinase
VRGWFVSFEGIEGVGKTTQIERLADALGARGFDVVQTREPGGTPLGVDIRELILAGRHTPVPLAELFLILADRAQHVAEVIRPALAAGRLVITDRYIDATVAYQAGGRAVDHGLVGWGLEAATGGLKPDLTLFLDLPVAMARERTRNRGAPNRIDKETEAFYRMVREAYLELVEREPGRIKVIDARADADSVHQSILSQVLQALGRGRVECPGQPPG